MSINRERSAEPVAIVGIGCRFPAAGDLRALWSLLTNGVDAIGEVPKDRFPLESIYDPTPATPGRISTRWGGFLNNLDGFDAQFFGMAPREAVHLDPQQRVLLEVAWEALEDAGIPPSTLAGSRTAVFVGLWVSDFEMRLSRSPRSVDVYTSTGSGRHSASGRLSFAFGLEGPSLTLDTACSSGLTAIHLACQSLRTGESSLALAGGANVILEPFITMAYSQAKMMSPDGRCKFGDANANGYVRSEGAGIVVLKPLSRALVDGDPIHAVILGSSVNNNGRSSGFLPRPAQHGHEEMLRQAYERAGVHPSEVQYIEAHGTGTIAGDPVELQALGSVLGKGRPADKPCLIGSIKTNIGHTEAAAGLAGIAKVALSLEHGLIPGNLHFREPSPRIPWSELPIRIPTTTEPWPECPKRIAGVSSFGISGTNAHVVLEAAPSRKQAVPQSSRNGQAQLLALSARSQESLQSLIGSYRALVAGRDTLSPLSELCGWAAGHRDHHPHRAAIVASDYEAMARNLAAAEERETHPLVALSRRPTYGAPAAAFVFPGQGGQWLGMGRELMAEDPEFRAALEECDAAIRSHVGWSVIEELQSNAERSRFDQIDVIQPTIFAIQVALAALWKSWGIRPAAVVGHSMGEVAAAVVADVLTVGDAARVVCARSGLMRRLSGKGAMGVVGMSFDETSVALRGYEGILSVAASNSASSTVVSGDRAALDELFASLQSREVFCRHVKVDVASHSPQMDAIARELVAALHGIVPRRATVPMYSTVLDRIIEGTECGPDYWMSNLREPVRFSSCVQQLLRDGITALLEISPHPVLESALTEAARDRESDVTIAVSTRRDENEREAMLAALGSLYVAGCSPEWPRVCPAGAPVALPLYPWHRERFWLDVERDGSPDITPLAATRIESSLHPGTFIWPTERKESLDDAGHDLLLSVLSSARELADGQSFELTSLELSNESASSLVELQRSAATVDAGSWSVKVALRRTTTWEVACSAFVRLVPLLTTAISDSGDAGETFEVTGDRDLLTASIDRLVEEAATWLGTPCRLARIGRFTTGAARPTVARCRPQLTRDGVEASVAFMDERGALVAYADDIILEPIAPPTADGCLHEVAWETVDLAGRAAKSMAFRDAILVVTASNSHTGSMLLDRLRADGCDLLHLCFEDVPASAPSHRAPLRSWEDVDHELVSRAAADQPTVGRVIVVADAVLDDGIEPFAAAVSREAMRLLEVVKWLSRTGRSASVRLWCVTRAGWPLGSSDERPNFTASALFGLTRSIVREYPELFCATADVSRVPQASEIDACVRLIHDGSDPAEVVLRHSTVFAPRIHRRGASSPAARIRSDATYLLTGGLGGMALEVADWLVRQGARHLALVGRRPPTAESRATVAALEAAGASIRFVSADVSQRQQVALAVDEIERSMPPVAGIVHAAAVLADALLSDCNRERFATVLGPKADGALHLHELTARWPLDFFVLCSSIAASIPQPGQGAYAAANAVLDAVAWHRRSRGLPACSVQWGIWAGTGLAKRGGTLRSFRDWARQGIGALTPATGHALLGEILATNSPSIFVAPVDWARVVASREGDDDARGLFTGMAPRPLADRGAASVPPPFANQSREERQHAVRRCLREQLAQVLRSDVGRIDPNRPLGTIGLDSLLAVEFVRRVSVALGIKLAATAVFSYPTLAAFEAEIVARFEPAESTTRQTDPRIPLQELPSEDEVVSMTDQDAIRTPMASFGGGQ
jgi:acyl transferase domain-containing protein/NAD(P)-dependent dehydrogenase (short-subunit alcohol dehydrogenase family)